MGLLDTLFGSSLQRGIDEGLDYLYGRKPGGMQDMLPPPGSSPGFAGGHFGGQGQGPLEQWRQPNPLGDSMDGEDIVVEAFKPKKRSFWGLLGDAFLMNEGKKPLFTERIYRKNMERAMRGVMDNPEQVIRRVATFDPEAAWKMRSQLVDDQRADASQQRLLGKDRESVIQRSAGILGQINEDGSNYDAVRTLYNNTMRRNQIDFELPEEFDPDLVGGLYTGAIAPDKQELNEYRQAMLEIRQKRLAQQGADTESKIEDRKVRANIAQQNADSSRIRANNSGKKGGAPAGAKPRKVKTKYGEGEVSPSGNTMKVKVGGVDRVYRRTGDNTWELVK